MAILTAVFLLSALAQVLINQEEQARQDLIQRFRARGQTGAQLISAYIGDLATREAQLATARLSDAIVSREAFDQFVESFGFEAAVLLDGEGRALHVHPESAGIIGQDLAGQYAHLLRAVEGHQAVSGVVPSAVEKIPVLAIAVPYETPSGRRVASGAFAIGASPLDQFVKNLLPFAAKVYMVDASNRIAASTVPVAEPFTPLSRQDPALYQGFRFESGQGYSSDGGKHVLTLELIPDTTWRLVMSVPEEQLFGPLDKVRWVPWLVFSGLVAASFIALVLLIRLWKSEAQLTAERRKLEERLTEQVRLNRALDEFAGRVAHDLRNPLGNALIAAQMAAKHKRDSTMLEKWLDTAQGQVRRGIELIQGLLDLAKAAGTPKVEPVDLNSLVTELAREIKGIDLQTEDLPSVKADRVALRQALANLIENAGRYARTNGSARVTVKAEYAETGWTISVEDEGPGLNPDEVVNIFRPFHRGRSHDIPGTGLGLAIVATTAKAHGGRAWYEARPEGGSKFNISIPEREPSAAFRPETSETNGSA